MRTAAVALFALSMSACSWAFMTKPPNPSPPPRVPIHCTESSLAPVLDVLIAVPNGIVALAGLAILSENSDEISEAIGSTLLISGGITALLYGLSARSGFKSSARCRELQNQRHYPQWPPARQGGPALRGPPRWNDPPR